MITQTACSPARQCWLRAWDRARTEKLIPYLNADGTWSVRGYTITVTGKGWSDLACTCPGGRHIACKHRSAVAKAIAVGVRPMRGTEKAQATPSIDVAAKPFMLQASTFTHVPTPLDELFM